MSRSLSLATPPADERVGEHHRAGARAEEEVGADAVHRRGQHGLVAARASPQPQLEPGDLRLEEGQAVDRRRRRARRRAGPARRARGVAARTCRPAADSSPENVPSRRAESWLPGVRTTAAPARRSRADHPVEHAGRVGRGHGAVVDVTGDHDDVDRFGGDHRGQAAEHGLLLGEQVGAVQGPADVPVGGVQQPHGRNVGGGTDRTGPGSP